MKKLISRRKFLAGSGAAASMALLGCDSTTYLPPDVRGGLMGAADVLTMASEQRGTERILQDLNERVW